MERLKLRLLVFVGIMVALGVVVFAAPQPNVGEEKSEEWMEGKLPKQAGYFKFRPGADNPEQSYKMDANTYKVLAPFGIVCRLYERLGQRFDVVVIASRDKDSFHDPRICFTASGFEIVQEQRVEIKTKSRGIVPATLASLADGGDRKLALFCYRGPEGFHGSTMSLKWAMFKEQFRGGQKLDAVFYRFIALTRGTTPEQLQDFVGEYLDSANESSGGYF